MPPTVGARVAHGYGVQNTRERLAAAERTYRALVQRQLDGLSSEWWRRVTHLPISIRVAVQLGLPPHAQSYLS
jgi:hypothetical protein